MQEKEKERWRERKRGRQREGEREVERERKGGRECVSESERDGGGVGGGGREKRRPTTTGIRTAFDNQLESGETFGNNFDWFSAVGTGNSAGRMALGRKLMFP